jgi:type IV pilus assembly protein PilA
MLKRKRGNQGFTLIEMIIAISIFTIVIGMGYIVLNKANVSMREQQVITNGQMNANLVNKYLTKDLEQSKEKIEIPKDTSGDYKYTINDIGTPIIYYIVKSEDKKYYDLIRESSEGEIEIITKQSMHSESPLTISSNSSNNNIYEVKLEYKENKINKEYKFNVAPRVSAVNEEVIPPTPIDPPLDPDSDDDFEGNNGFIQFGYRNKNDTLDKIWVDAGPQGNSANNKTPEPIDVPKYKDEHSINVYIRTATGNGKLDATMNKNIQNELKAKMQNNKVIKKEQNRVKISKFGDVDLIGEIIITYGKNKKQEKFYIPLKNENYVYDIDTIYNGKTQESIEITGNIKKPIGSKGYGEILIQFGKKS